MLSSRHFSNHPEFWDDEEIASGKNEDILDQIERADI
jgi:hypothetical protein